jgi:anti-anti-sigma factor
MTLDRYTSGEAQVLTPRRNLVGGEETRSLTAAVEELASGGSPRVIVDLGKISWVNSLGLEGLKKARKACLDRDGWFRLACVGQRIESVLLTTRLVVVFDTFETVDEALSPPEKASSPS